MSDILTMSMLYTIAGHDFWHTMHYPQMIFTINECAYRLVSIDLSTPKMLTLVFKRVEK